MDSAEYSSRTLTPKELMCFALLTQVLHDAFFKHQTKPKLTGQGDLYYEGKEFEVSLFS